MYSGGFMRNTTTLLVGLSTVLLFFSTHGIPLVIAQSAGPNDQTSNDNSASQTQNSDPFTQKGLDNNINTGSDNSPSQTSDGSSNNNDGSKTSDGSSNNNDGSKTSDGSSNNNDGSKTSDGSTSSNHDDNNKGSDNSKSSNHKDSKPDNHGIPFP